MKNREENIENTFLKLLEERNIETIDVQTIVDALGIKRQTFYSFINAKRRIRN